MELLDRHQLFEKFPTLYRGGSVYPAWLPDGRCAFMRGGVEDYSIHAVDRQGRIEHLVDTERARKAIEQETRRPLPFAGLPFDRFWLAAGGAAIGFELEGVRYYLNMESYVVTRASVAEMDEAARTKPRFIRQPLSAGEPTVTEIPSPDGAQFLTEVGSDLGIRSGVDGTVRTLTSDGDDHVKWNVVWASWSPDAARFVARRIDNTGVPCIPVAHWLGEEESITLVPYTRAGGREPSAALHVFDVRAGTSVIADLGSQSERSFYPLGWRPGHPEVIVVTVSRDHKTIKVVLADQSSGATRLVLEESADTFVGGWATAPHARFVPLSDGERFVWLSERDGWQHAYLYDYDGVCLGQLTSGDFAVRSILAVDESDGVVYFGAPTDQRRPYDTHVCRVRLDGTGFAALTDDPGLHTPAFAPDFSYFLDSHSSPRRAPRTDVRDHDGAPLATIANADTSWLDELGWTPPEEFVVLADDDETELWGALYLPPDFDASKSYPVIDVIYGGPQCWDAPQEFGQFANGARAAALAQLGYAAFVLDGRGTPGRSKAFQDVGYGAFAQHVVPDHTAALRQLGEARPYLDLSRVGVVGGSWGGYMTIRCLLTAPDTFHVGVSLVPVADLGHLNYAIEPYMGLPQDNPMGYAAADLIPLAGNLQGKLLLCPAMSDVNAPFSATMRLVDAFTKSDREYDLAVFNEQTHWVTGQAGRYLSRRCANYFLEHLTP